MKKFFILLLVLGTSAYAGQIKSKNFDANYAQVHDQEQIESMQKEIQSLNSKIEKLEHTLSLIKQQIVNPKIRQTPEEGISDDALANADVVDGKPITGAKAIVKTPGETKVEAVAKGAEKQQYDMALAALKDNDVKSAAEKFEAFINNYPHGQLLSNAYFWYGETFFKQKTFDKAALQYLKSYKHAPKGAKASDSLFKLALSLNELKKIPDACGMLNKLDSEFPSRPIASVQKVQALRTQMKCK